MPDFLDKFEKPVLLLWQNDPDIGLDWIAYAPIDEDTISSAIGKTKKGWYLGDGDGLPTILVKVIRNSTYPEANEIRVYLAGPEPQGSADTIPINYNNRKTLS